MRKKLLIMATTATMATISIFSSTAIASSNTFNINETASEIIEVSPPSIIQGKYIDSSTNIPFEINSDINETAPEIIEESSPSMMQGRYIDNSTNIYLEPGVGFVYDFNMKQKWFSNTGDHNAFNLDLSVYAGTADIQIYGPNGLIFNNSYNYSTSIRVTNCSQGNYSVYIYGGYGSKYEYLSGYATLTSYVR